MSVFGSIVSAIFGHSASHSPAVPTPASTAQSNPASARAGQAAPPSSPVDVEAIMDKLARQSKEKLDWRRSIVDLMKLLDLDSSLTARKQLAKELHYTGNMSDTASMNIWLHKQVMSKLAEKRVKTLALGGARAKYQMGGGKHGYAASSWGRVLRHLLADIRRLRSVRRQS
jgi:Domain of unknown function (DUF3597)